MRRLQGFTLIELVMVIVLTGIVAVTVMPRLSFDSIRESGYTGELLDAIHFAHKLSLTSGCGIQVDLSTNSFALNYSGAGPCSAGALNHPATGQPYAAAAPAGVSIGGSGFSYDAFGRASVGQLITVGSRRIQLVAETGFAYEP